MFVENDPVGAFTAHPDVPVANADTGPLAGVTFAVKDIYDVAGYVTGCGSPEKYAETPPATRHAAVVQKLLDAGTRFVGKTHTAELAFSLDGRNEHYGTPRNPAAPGRVPGGSSSGSAAAVAAGLVDLALGSDTGGSVRGPASFCGLVGHRPTFGRIDISGAMPLAETFDTVGWFTRDIDLYARVGAVLLGEDVEGPEITRAVVGRDAFAQLKPPAAAAFASAVARVNSVLQNEGEIDIAEHDRLGDWQHIFRLMQGYEAWRAHGPWITTRKPQLNPAVALRFDLASKVTTAEYEEAQSARIERRRRLSEIVGKDRILVIPTMPDIAPRLDATEEAFEDFRSRALPLMCMAGLSGLPQISLPLVTLDGCPIGLSLIGPPGRDRALIEIARRVIAA